MANGHLAVVQLLLNRGAHRHVSLRGRHDARRYCRESEGSANPRYIRLIPVRVLSCHDRYPPCDLARNTLAILCIIGLIGLSLWVLRPFLAATVWAAMLVVATWPLFRSLELRLGGRRGPAVAIMSVAMLLLLVLPLWLAIDTILEHSGQLAAAGKSLAEDGLPQPPAWVGGLPLIGERVAGAWGHLAAGGAAGVIGKVTPYAADAGKWVLAQVGGLGGMLIQFLLVVTISADPLRQWRGRRTHGAAFWSALGR